MNVNWGACQARGEGCPLDQDDPTDPTYYTPPKTCMQGSISSHYINVTRVEDIRAGLDFARKYDVPLVIKNTGHDYKGRSSAPGSLALWMHHYPIPTKLTRNFTPEGCSSPEADGITVGAGAIFEDIYQFAEEHNVTVVGGRSPTVGLAGGWISGGGHRALSNTYGLGDQNRPGSLVTANRCQNQDLFFALRGGGGGTFGINTEVTTTAFPQVSLQVAYIRFLAPNDSVVNEWLRLCIDRADDWANEGWGGYIIPGVGRTSISGLVLMTPKMLSTEAAKKSMAPLTAYITSLSASETTTTVLINNTISLSPSFLHVYKTFILPNADRVGLSTIQGSRLLPRALFRSPSTRQTLHAAIRNASNLLLPYFPKDPDPSTAGPVLILLTAPSSYNSSSSSRSSVTPALALRPLAHHPLSQPAQQRLHVHTHRNLQIYPLRNRHPSTSRAAQWRVPKRSRSL